METQKVSDNDAKGFYARQKALGLVTQRTTADTPSLKIRIESATSIAQTSRMPIITTNPTTLMIATAMMRLLSGDSQSLGGSKQLTTT